MWFSGSIDQFDAVWLEGKRTIGAAVAESSLVRGECHHRSRLIAAGPSL